MSNWRKRALGRGAHREHPATSRQECSGVMMKGRPAYIPCRSASTSRDTRICLHPFSSRSPAARCQQLLLNRPIGISSRSRIVRISARVPDTGPCAMRFSRISARTAAFSSSVSGPINFNTVNSSSNCEMRGTIPRLCYRQK